MRGWIVFLMTSLWSCAVVHAQTTVRVGNGTGCTHTPAQLLQAIENANNFGSPNRVLINTGSYTLTNFSAGVVRGNLFLEGGYPSCTASTPTGTSTIAASGGRVMSFEQPVGGERRTLTLRDLVIGNGMLPITEQGGALRFLGNLEVRLENTVVAESSAGFGAGIYVARGGASDTVVTLLRLDSGSRVVSNDAGNGLGGGIYCASGARVRLGNNVKIEGNSASGGGGLFLANGCERLDVLPGVGATEAVSVSVNVAGTTAGSSGFGGGIYSFRTPINVLASGGLQHALYLLGNTGNIGGAVYAGGAASGAGQVVLDINNSVIGGNTAREKGGAFYLSGGVRLQLDHIVGSDCQFLGVRGCSLIVQNNSENTGHSDPGGGALFLTSPGRAIGNHAQAVVRRTMFLANSDDRAAVAMAGPQTELDMEGVIVTGNTGAVAPSYMIQGFSTHGLRFRYSTMTGNTGPTLRLIRAEGGITVNIAGSILWNPGTSPNQPIVWNSGGDNTIVHVACVVVHSTDGLPNPASIEDWAVNPRLDQRYAPRGGSPAIDHCDDIPTPLPGLDFYRGPRDHDTVSMPQRWGIRDLGAVEQRDIIHYSGFGSRPTN